MSVKNVFAFSIILLLFSCNRKANEYSRTELKKRTFNYFWETVDKNYQVPDRYPSLTFSSIAATGFGLSSYIVGAENKFITREEAADRTLKTLATLFKLPQHYTGENVGGYKGFFYHFLTLDNAIRYKDVELSSIDTGLLMAGVLSVMTYFDKDNETEKSIRYYADQLYKRVDWTWMLSQNNSLYMGWHPETGFISSKWNGYNEAMILLIMAIGSPTHPIPPASWQKWCETYEFKTFMGETNIQFDPLFGHQYSHIFIDFRGIKDDYCRVKNIDYFENSVRATKSNRNYCISNPSKFNGYSKDVWGLTACDGPFNGKKNIKGKEYDFFDYRARGAASMNIVDDGTIAPTAAGGSMPFLPKECETSLQYMWNKYNKNLVGKYGFKDAFNLTYVDDKNPKGWFDIDYLGIDQGPILLQMENHETELIWKVMKKNKYLVNGLKKAGFRGGWLDGDKEF